MKQSFVVNTKELQIKTKYTFRKEYFLKLDSFFTFLTFYKMLSYLKCYCNYLEILQRIPIKVLFYNNTLLLVIFLYRYQK